MLTTKEGKNLHFGGVKYNFEIVTVAILGASTVSWGGGGWPWRGIYTPFTFSFHSWVMKDCKIKLRNDTVLGFLMKHLRFHHNDGCFHSMAKSIWIKSNFFSPKCSTIFCLGKNFYSISICHNVFCEDHLWNDWFEFQFEGTAIVYLILGYSYVPYLRYAYVPYLVRIVTTSVVEARALAKKGPWWLLECIENLLIEKWRSELLSL